MEADNAIRAVFERIDREAASTIGHQLFTVTAFDATTMEVQRVYSSNPDVYPVGGRKPKRDTEFGQRVLIEGKPLVCEGDAAIARVFDDHETIRELGLHSSINVPVVNAGCIVGVLNFLFSGETISSDQLRAAFQHATDSDVMAAFADIPPRTN